MMETTNGQGHTPVGRRDLLKREPGTLTPQQAARAYVRSQRAVLERGFLEYFDSEKMGKVWAKVYDMALNGHVKAIDLLLRHTIPAVSAPDEAALGGSGVPFVVNIVPVGQGVRQVVSEQGEGG